MSIATTIKKIGKKITVTATVSLFAAGFMFVSLPVSAQSGQVTIALTVRNLNLSGPSYWSKSITASASDRLEFNISFKSAGSSILYNPRVSVSLPSGLRYVNGSTRIGGFAANEGIISYGGLPLENMVSQEIRTITLQADVLDGNSSYSSTLSPYAMIQADNLLNSFQDGVTIQLGGGSVAGAAIGPTYSSQFLNNSSYYMPLISLNESGFNVTRGGTQYVHDIQALSGDIIELAFNVRNDSSYSGGISNVFIVDSLPQELSYVSKSTYIENMPGPDGITKDGISLGSLANGQMKTVKFRVRVADNLSTGTYLKNKPSVWADGSQNVFPSDSYVAYISISQPRAVASAGVGAGSVGGENSAGRSVPVNAAAASGGEVLGAATVKTGPSGTVILITLFSLFVAVPLYYRFRRDRILLPFQFWEDWRLKSAIRRLSKEKSE